MAPTKPRSPHSTPSPSKVAAIGQVAPKNPGWSAQDKSALFAHVRKYGETNWGQAVPGKTTKQENALTNDSPPMQSDSRSKMPQYRPSKRRQGEDDKSPAPHPKRKGQNKREVTYDTYDEAMDGGVDFEEKGERYRDGERAQRNYERALELYQKAWTMQQTFDAAYNQARVLYTLSTSFFLPPASLESISRSIELFRQCLSLTDSSILQMDAGFNLAQSDTALADMLDDLSGDLEGPRIKALRMEASNVLSQVLAGQEAYLAQQAQEATEETQESAGGDEMEVEAGSGTEAAGEATDIVEGANEAAARPDAAEAQDDEGETSTYETHLPTASALLDTALAFVDVQLALWESALPLALPTDEAQAVVRNIMDRAAPHCPSERQAEMDLMEIKILLALDTIVWDMFKSDARVGTGVERSLEGAIGALTSVLSSMDASPPEDPTIRADAVTTLATCHSTLANRFMLLSPQLPPGANPLAQQAWFHQSQAVTLLGKALDSPLAGAPKEYKPNVLLDLSKASLARARLGDVNDTAKRNLAQLVENASAYAARAGEALGLPWVRLNGPASTQLSTAEVELPSPAGWDAELIGREVVLQQIRVCLYASEMDLEMTVKGKLNDGMSKLFQLIKRVPEERRIGASDVERWVEDIVDEEGVISDKEKTWWERVVQELGA